MVKDMVDKFLDMYVGGGVNITVHIDFLFYDNNSKRDKYVVRSDNGTIILFFIHNHIGGVNFHFSFQLLEVMGNMFSESREQCREYIRSWFCKRHKINDYRELLSYPIIDKKYERDSI
jgi:hypothetical protein